jgi:hypothetical protein
VDIPAKPQKQLSMIDPLLFLLSRQLLLLRQSHSTPTSSGLLSLQDAFPHFVPKKIWRISGPVMTRQAGVQLRWG